jgi:hypothetical protein
VNTTDFFETILPEQGKLCVVRPRPNGKWKHSWCDTIAQFETLVARFDAAGETVYFAVNSFKAVGTWEDGNPCFKRQQTHVVYTRSLFIDLDVRDPHDPKPAKRPEYASLTDAFRAIKAFCKALGLPLPWFNCSGVGVHTFWPFTDDVPVEHWQPVAEALKAALVAHKILFDPSRTADAASVLRPPGSTHRKIEGHHRPVFQIKDGAVTDFAALAQKLLPWMMAPAAAPRAASGKPGPSAALSGGMELPPSSAYKVADRCGVMSMIRDTRGNVDEPTWYAGLSVLTKTEEAPAICHEWSDGHPDYSPAATDKKLAQLVDRGPATCKTMDGLQHDICATCPWNGKITSPIQLGRAQYDAPPEGEPETAAGGGGRGAFGGGTAAAGSSSGGGSGGDMPWGYRAVKGPKGHKVLEHFIKGDGDKKADKWEVFSDTCFYPVQRYKKDELHFNEWLVEDKDTSRTFEMAGGVINKGGRDVAGVLGENGIVTKPGKERVMDGYLKHWMDKLKDQPLVVSRQSFGWTDDFGFVTGELAIAPDGSEADALLHNTAREKRHIVRCEGSLEVWKDLVDRAYNAPGQEALQFQMLVGFAAPLLRLTRQVQGITVYAHSTGSGTGKTTVQKAALSVWGDHTKMMMARTTANALWALLGAYNTLPVVYDELTNADAEDISDLVFAVSQGRPKERLNQAAKLQDNTSGWTTILLASGNVLLSDKLAGHRTNTEAEIARLFQFSQEMPHHLSVAEANEIFPQFETNYGHAGLAFARSLVKNRAKVAKALRIIQDRVNKDFEIQAVDRHWSALFACILVALKLCRDLKLVGFEEAPLYEWMRDRLADNRSQKAASITTEEDQLSAMINDIMPHTLITLGMGTARSFADIQVRPPTGTLQGRKIIAQGTTPAVTWLSRPAIREWCRVRGANEAELHRTAISLGWAYPKLEQRVLGQGTDLSSGVPVVCWIMDPSKMPEGISPTLTVIQGGRAGRP